MAEAGLMDVIRNGDYTLYDRDQTETSKEREEMMHKAFFADFFLGSTNALHRARNEAAPINAQRFQKETPCVSGGTCFDCKKQGCICSQILITRYSQIPGRIKVILVNESLGF